MKEENVISQSKLVQDIEKMTSTKNPYFVKKALQDLQSKVSEKTSSSSTRCIIHFFFEKKFIFTEVISISQIGLLISAME